MMLCVHTFLLCLRRLCSLYSAVHTNSDELVWFFGNNKPRMMNVISKCKVCDLTHSIVDAV